MNPASPESTPQEAAVSSALGVNAAAKSHESWVLRMAAFRSAVADSLRTHRTLGAVWRTLAWLAVVLAVACALYPSDHEHDYQTSRGGEQEASVMVVEEGVRHLNSLMAIALPLIHRDLVGLAQLAVVAVVGTAATHIPKRLCNDWVIAGTRLGQRPHRHDSKGNVPSGHSSLASCAAFFVCRRYGWRWAWLLLPITLATMWARVMLDQHTMSAVFAGLFVGVAVALFFVKPRTPKAA